MGHSRPDYSAGHVNRLAAMVGRHLAMPHEVVCITDDPEGIDGAVRVIPLWDELRSSGRCFVRLKAFHPSMRDIIGERFVSIDLDTVIVGSLDPLFDRSEPFIIWSDPSRLLPYCGSQWMLTAGAFPKVFDDFNYERWRLLKPEKNWHGSDQAWMAHMLPGAATWGKDDGVYSFRLDIMKPYGEMLAGRFRRMVGRYGPPKLPKDARIVHFHGAFDPSQNFLRECVPWIDSNWRL